MAYSAHPTVVTGQTWSAANQNQYVKGNFDALWPFTTAGDLAYATGATALNRLAIGTARQVLRVNSGATAPEWATMAGFTPYVPRKSNASWDGDTKTPGTYTLAATDFDASIPSGAVALLICLSASWGSAGGGNTCNLAPSGHSNNCLIVRAHDTLSQDNIGFVPLVSGNFDVIVAGANAAVALDVWGYLR